ncbi:hypothetical protein JVT61DRAFT_10076 [Boletus reticuloceps]|uniref:Uncharacterized protein n=1 Tax=Boletus reticuloceps TaxID=495285 RepID=A0A8I2YXK1_9AGAM|nr:hypothetical protein JVT61DRAFT_10076 [Boletus reticuloceps]
MAPQARRPTTEDTAISHSQMASTTAIEGPRALEVAFKDVHQLMQDIKDDMKRFMDEMEHQYNRIHDSVRTVAQAHNVGCAPGGEVIPEMV